MNKLTAWEKFNKRNLIAFLSTWYEVIDIERDGIYLYSSLSDMIGGYQIWVNLQFS
jgi:hypothetical protein